MMMVMLHQGIKLMGMLLLITTVVSCSRYKEYNAKEIQEIRKRNIDYALSILGQDEYWGIYDKINDSINMWKINNLGLYKYYGVSKEYLVDSIICINRHGDKIITSVLLRQLLEEGIQDDIKYFYGVKIRGTWYFFGGATLVLPREYYQKDIHTPLSFEKLKQIATWNIYRRYLKKNTQGEWEINERFFENLSKYDAYSRPFTTQESYDESWLQLMRENWSKRDKK
jgi:hypothetical protein